jgi:uncharacterized protein (TIGR03083 family)
MPSEVGSARVNVMDPSGKDYLLRVVRADRQTFYDRIDHMNDAQWHGATPCTEWDVRDIVGHMVDVTEEYIAGFKLALASDIFGDPLGVRPMAQIADERARALRNLTQPQLIARLKSGSDELFGIFGSLDAQQWGGLMVPHLYMGPLPAFFFPVFQLMDYCVHVWDLNESIGRPAPLSEEGSGTLVPFMFVLMQSTVDAETSQNLTLTCGIEVPGPYGGSWRVEVTEGAMRYEEGDTEGCQVVFHFRDPGEFVLTSFQRIRGGTATGDLTLEERFRNLFFKI